MDRGHLDSPLQMKIRENKVFASKRGGALNRDAKDGSDSFFSRYSYPIHMRGNSYIHFSLDATKRKKTIMSLM